MNNLTTIYLFRHGFTEWNKSGKIQGHSDSPLTEEGKTQLKEIAEKFRDVKFDYVFSSDLGRAMESAKILKLERDLAVKATELLRERDYGKLDGGNGEIYKTWINAMNKLPEEERYAYKHTPYVESNEEIVKRFMTFIREMAILDPGKTVLVVSHGGLIRAVLLKLGFGTYEELGSGAVKNGGWAKIETDGIDFFVLEHEGIKNNENKYAE